MDSDVKEYFSFKKSKMRDTVNKQKMEETFSKKRKQQRAELLSSIEMKNSSSSSSSNTLVQVVQSQYITNDEKLKSLLELGDKEYYELSVDKGYYESGVFQG